MFETWFANISIYGVYIYILICQGGVHLTSHQKWKKITWDNTSGGWSSVDFLPGDWSIYAQNQHKPTISMKEDPQPEAKFWCENQSCEVLIRCPLSLLGAKISIPRMVKDHKCPPIVNRRMSHNILQYDLVFFLSDFFRDFSQSSPVFSVFSLKYRNIHEYPKNSQRKIMKRSPAPRKPRFRFKVQQPSAQLWRSPRPLGASPFCGCWDFEHFFYPILNDYRVLDHIFVVKTMEKGSR